MIKIKASIIFLVLISIIDCCFHEAYAQRQKIDPISFGPVNFGEDRIPIELTSFKVIQNGQYEIKAKMVPNSIQWIRLDQTVLIPRALIEISFLGKNHFKYSWEYANQRITPMYNESDQRFRAQIFISLFESFPLELYEDEKVVQTIRLKPAPKKYSHLIDYSCAPYSVEVEGMRKDYLSLGCRIQKVGKFGDERPYLEILFTSASYRLKDNSEPPYLAIFHQSGQTKFTLVDYEGNEEVVTIKAKIPTKIHRLKLAGGLGPYNLSVKSEEGNSKNEFAPTVMLYGNFSLNNSSSVRFFDSYSRQRSIFHNWGLYYAWDLAKFCDQRCLLTSLIGAQGIDYRYDNKDNFKSQIIYPQGFEFNYKHPFGKLNYKFSYGMFLSFSGIYDYQNIWIRYGKNFFWELNFIGWKKENQNASMYGLSVGFPITSFF